MKNPNSKKLIDFTKTTTFSVVIIVIFIIITYWLSDVIQKIMENSYNNIYFWTTGFLIIGFITWLYHLLKQKKNISEELHEKNQHFNENLIRLDEIALFLASEATAKYFKNRDPELYNVYPISFLTKFEKNLGKNSYVFYDRPYIIEGREFTFLKKVMDENIAEGVTYRTFDNTSANNAILPKSFGFVVYADTNLSDNKGIGFQRQQNSFLHDGNTANFLINAYYIIPLTKGTNSKKLELIFAVRITTDSELSELLNFIKRQ